MKSIYKICICVMLKVEMVCVQRGCCGYDEQMVGVKVTISRNCSASATIGKRFWSNFIFRYFVGVVLQFQLFESLCEIAGHTGDLHTCDFYRSREAGRLLSCVIVNCYVTIDKN